MITRTTPRQAVATGFYLKDKHLTRQDIADYVTAMYKKGGYEVQVEITDSSDQTEYIVRVYRTA